MELIINCAVIFMLLKNGALQFSQKCLIML